MLAPSGSPATINVRCWAVRAAKPATPATENQHRDVQRQDQQRQQQAAALEAHGQGRADGAEQAQHRRTEQQESSSTGMQRAGRPSISANSGDIRTRASPENSQCASTLASTRRARGAAKGPTAPENRPRNRCGTALPARAARPIAPPPRPGRATRFVAIGSPARPPGEQGDDDGEEHQRIGQLRRSAEQQARLARQEQAEDVAHAGSPSAGSTVAPLAALSAPRSSSR